MSNSLENRIISMIKDNAVKGLDLDNIGMETDLFADLGFVSISVIQLVIQIENEFNIELDMEDMDIERLQKVGSLIEIVSKKVKE